MADDFAAVAVAQHAITPAADGGRSFQPAPSAITTADRAERAIQLFSRWAGIAAFAGTLAVLAYLII